MKTIVITGGSDGLGRALAEHFSQGNKVIILARNEEALQEVASRTGCEYVVCDVRDAQQVVAAFKEITTKHATIDVLINNAGVIVNGELGDISNETIQNVITTNTLGTIYVAKAIVGYMRAQNTDSS